MKLINAQKMKYGLEKLNSKDKDDLIIDLSEIKKIQEIKQKNMKTRYKTGNIEISFAWNSRIVESNKVQPTVLQKNTLHDLIQQENDLKKNLAEILDQMQIKNESKDKANEDETDKETEDNKEEDTKGDKDTEKDSKNVDETDKTSDDKKANEDDEQVVKADEGKPDVDVQLEYKPDLWALDHDELLRIPEIKAIIEEDESLLDDKTYTYYDYEGENKMYLILRIFDNKYSDEHRMIIFFPINFKNRIVHEEIKLEVENGQELPPIQNETNTESTKTEEDNTDTTTETVESDTKNDSTTSSPKAENPFVNTDDAKPNDDNKDGTTNESKDTITQKMLIIDFEKALIEPNPSFSKVTAYKFFNIDKSFKCRFKGNIKFNNSIFSDSNSLNKQIIHLDKLKSTADLIELRLYSSENDCNLNIQATAQYEKPVLIRKTILFVFFVIVLG
jgi:hypothetical protein